MTGSAYACDHQTMIATTDRFIITELTMDMAQAIHEDSLDTETRKYLPDEVFETLGDAQETIKFLMSKYGTAKDPLVYAIIRKEDQCCIGYVQAVTRKDNTWEIGYHIGSHYRGNGYATDAVKVFLPIMAKTIGFKEIYGICLIDNIASRRVLDKCGFEILSIGMGHYHGKPSEIIKTRWKVPNET